MRQFHTDSSRFSFKRPYRRFILGCMIAASVCKGLHAHEPPPIGESSLQLQTVDMPPSAWNSDNEDPIERELLFQRALAISIQGDSKSALAMLGDEDDTATLYAAAMLLMDAGKIQEGVKLLETLLTRKDAPATTSKLLAVGYLHLEQPQAAEAAIEVYLGQNSEDPYANYVHGLAMLRQEQPEQAKLALYQAGYDEADAAKIEQVVMQAPVDVTLRRSTIAAPVTTAQLQNDLNRSRGSEKNYSFTMLFAGEYDSNVPLQPRFSGLGSNFEREDYRFLMASFLDLQLLSTEDFNIGLVGSTYNTFQFNLNQFNIQDYMGGAYANTMLADDYVGSLRYEFHETLVNSSQFATEHRLTPSFTRLTSYGHTTGYYEFNPIDSDAPFLIPEQNQAASINRVGFTQALYTMGGQGRIYGGYQFSDADAKGSDFDRSSHMVTGRIERPLSRTWIADLDVRYIWDDFENPNSLDFFDRPRQDRRVEVRTGLQKNFRAPVSLRFDYTYFNNDSNTENLFGVRFYDYDRHIFSTQLIFSL